MHADAVEAEPLLAEQMRPAGGVSGQAAAGHRRVGPRTGGEGIRAVDRRVGQLRTEVHGALGKVHIAFHQELHGLPVGDEEEPALQADDEVAGIHVDEEVQVAAVEPGRQIQTGRRVAGPIAVAHLGERHFQP